jgi:hypothetical protein
VSIDRYRRAELRALDDEARRAGKGQPQPNARSVKLKVRPEVVLDRSNQVVCVLRMQCAGNRPHPRFQTLGAGDADDDLARWAARETPAELTEQGDGIHHEVRRG